MKIRWMTGTIFFEIERERAARASVCVQSKLNESPFFASRATVPFHTRGRLAQLLPGLSCVHAPRSMMFGR